MKKYIRFFLIDKKEPYQGFGKITEFGIQLHIDSGIYQNYPWWRIKEWLVVEEEFKNSKTRTIRSEEDMISISNLLGEGKSTKDPEYIYYKYEWDV